MCPHTPACPEATAPDREAARTVVSHPEQGWSLLCNGIVVFEDTGELLPGGGCVAPHRPTDAAMATFAGPGAPLEPPVSSAPGAPAGPGVSTGPPLSPPGPSPAA